ncbi:MAG: hypothetical protein V4509_01845 [Patescibacteria group bacterium]
MTVTSGETQREAAALADSLTNQSNSNPPQQDQVPVHVVQSLREELRAEKEKNETFRNHMQMMQWQQNSAPQQQQNPFGNSDPEDSIKIKDAVKMMSDYEQRTNAQLAEIKLASRTPDYKDVIQKYLPKAAQEDPELLEEIKRSPNPYKTAYMAAKASEAYRADFLSSNQKSSTQSQTKAQPVDNDVEKMIQNSKQSGNLASVGNNARALGGTPDYRNMSDEEFRQLKSKNLFKSKSK